jgi:hypothetical protein
VRSLIVVPHLSHFESFIYEHALIAVPHLSHSEIFNYEHALIVVPHLSMFIVEDLTMTVR